MRKETIDYNIKEHLERIYSASSKNVELTDSDIIRINEALKANKIKMPRGMSREEKRAFIISKAE